MNVLRLLCSLGFHGHLGAPYDPYEGGIWSNPAGSVRYCDRCGNPAVVLTEEANWKPYRGIPPVPAKAADSQEQAEA